MSTSSVDGPRPQVPTTYVIPTLAGWAHKVFELSSSTDGAQPCIFLGPQQAHERVAGSSPVPPIAGIVNCTNSFPNVEHDSIDFCRVAVNDENGANILVYLDGATRFIDRTLKLGGSVLVHCQMGVSRSATVVIAYLMRYHSFSRDDAYRHVKERRPQIRPNEGFWRQLNIYQARLTGRTTDSTAHNQVFDREWAEQSLANFQTIGHLIDDKAECFPEVTPRTNESQILFVATDFVFGRGNQDADLPWFGALCFTLFKRGLDPIAAFDDLLSAGSDFVELWSGEVYPRDVERLTSTIRSAIGSTYGAEDTCFPKTQAP